MACIVLCRSKAGFVDSNSTRRIGVFMHFFRVFRVLCKYRPFDRPIPLPSIFFRSLREKIKDLKNGIPWIALSIGTTIGTKRHLMV